MKNLRSVRRVASVEETSRRRLLLCAPSTDMLGGDRGSRGRRKINLGSKPRLLVGTAIGTLATYVLFVHHYTTKISAENLGARSPNLAQTHPRLVITDPISSLRSNSSLLTRLPQIPGSGLESGLMAAVAGTLVTQPVARPLLLIARLVRGWRRVLRRRSRLPKWLLASHKGGGGKA